MCQYAPDLVKDPAPSGRLLSLGPTSLGILLFALGAFFVLGDLPPRVVSTHLAGQLRHICGAAAGSIPRDDSRNSWWIALITSGEATTATTTRTHQRGMDWHV
jgi:hypothetical protein